MKFHPALIFIVLFIIGSKLSFAQDDPGAVIFHIQSSHTAFPDTGRAKGHVYSKVLYTEAEHYHDSTVLLSRQKTWMPGKRSTWSFGSTAGAIT